jgi:hypothetical protein
MTSQDGRHGGAEFYSLDDFHRVDKIDMHVHLNSFDTAFLDQAEEDGFRLLTVNVEYAEFPPIEEQLRIAISMSKLFPGKVAYASTFSMKGWDEADWEKHTIEHVDKALAGGACAVKVWKNIGMEFRDRSGKLVMIDHPQFDPVFAHLRRMGVPLIGHLGEPRDCWLPHDQIVVKYIRDYFVQHPQYHMYLQPEMPSYEAQLAARDGMLERNKGIIFVGAHLASLEWSVRELAAFLDRFPSAVVDVAARVGDLQYQTVKNRESVRSFFIKYQDRILYATDTMWQRDADLVECRKDIHDKWVSDWRYLCTESPCRVADLDEPVHGLQLPRTPIDKIYRTNAQRIFHRFQRLDSEVP